MSGFRSLESLPVRAKRLPFITLAAVSAAGLRDTHGIPLSVRELEFDELAIVTERSTKKLLIEALKETGDNPEDVRCTYSRRWRDRQSGPMPTHPQCSATDLPEGELTALSCFSKKYVYKLIKTEEGVRIKTTPKY